jgi:hypothetical protein
MRFIGTVIASGALTIAGLPVGAATFTPGEFVTYDQTDFGTNDRLDEPFNPQAAALLENNFDTVFAPFEDLLQVGVPGPAGYSLIFDSPDAVLAYLPAGGSPAPLTADLLDPLTRLPAFSVAKSSTRRSTLISRMPACWRIRPVSRSAISCSRT